MLYRVLEGIKTDKGLKFTLDSVSTLRGVSPSAIEILLRLNRIAEVQSPPLRILPGWEKRAELLEPLGIVNVDDLVTADLKKVARKLGVSLKGLRKSAAEAQVWIEVSK